APRANLVLVIGDERQTYWVIRELEPATATALAADMCRRLSAFRTDRGLQPVESDETTEADQAAADLRSCSLPGPRHRPSFRDRAMPPLFWPLTNRWVATLTCATGVTGMFAADRLLTEVDLGPLTYALFPLGVFYVVITLAVWCVPRIPARPPAPTTPAE